MTEHSAIRLSWSERRRTLKRFRYLICNPLPGNDAWQSELNDLLAKVNSQGIRGIDDLEQLSRDRLLSPYLKAWLAFQRALLLSKHGDATAAINALHQAALNEDAGNSRPVWLTAAADRMVALGRRDLAIDYCTKAIGSNTVGEDVVRSAISVLMTCITLPTFRARESEEGADFSKAIREWTEILSKTDRRDATAYCRIQIAQLCICCKDFATAHKTIAALDTDSARSMNVLWWSWYLDLAIASRNERPLDALDATLCFARHFALHGGGEHILRGAFLFLAADCFHRLSRPSLASAALQLAGLPPMQNTELDGSDITADVVLSVAAKQFTRDVFNHPELRALPAYPTALPFRVLTAAVAPRSVPPEIVAACDALLQHALSKDASGPPQSALRAIDRLDPFEDSEACDWVAEYLTAAGLDGRTIPLIETMEWRRVLRAEIYDWTYEVPTLPTSLHRRLSEACRCAYVDRDVRKASELFLQLATDEADELPTEDRIRALCWIAIGAARVGCVASGERIVSGAMRIPEMYSAHPVERLRLLGIACSFLGWNGGCEVFPRLCLSVARDAYAQCISLKANAPGYSDADRGDLFSISWDFKIVLSKLGHA